MIRTLGVWWDGRIVGRLTQDIHGALGFAYGPEWLRQEDAPALSVSLPRREEPFSRRECRPFFGGLLPEESQRDAVARVRWASRVPTNSLFSIDSEAMSPPSATMREVDTEAEPMISRLGLDATRGGRIRARPGRRGFPFARKSMESRKFLVHELVGRTRIRRAAVAMTAFALLAGAGAPAADDSRATVDRAGAYGGVFAGSGRMGNRLVDVDGFANWGNPGSVVDYDDNRAGRRRARGKEVRAGRHPAEDRARRDVRLPVGEFEHARSRRPRRDGGDRRPMARDGRASASRIRSAPRRCSPPPGWRRPGSTGPSPTSTSARTCRIGSIPTTPSTTARRNSAG